MNGNALLAYVEQILAPTLSLGDLVILDNLRSGLMENHKTRQLNG